MFIFCIGFWKLCFYEFIIIMSDFFDYFVYWILVGVYIQYVYENRYYNVVIVEVFMFIYFFDDYDFFVCWCNYNFFCILFEKLDGIMEKVNY